VPGSVGARLSRSHPSPKRKSAPEGRFVKSLIFLNKMARPKRFELLTPRFVVWCSIQLSYGRLSIASPWRKPPGRRADPQVVDEGIATASFPRLQASSWTSLWRIFRAA
jgi:hypothetical protein